MSTCSERFSLRPKAGPRAHSDFKTTRGYIDLAGETFRRRAEGAQAQMRSRRRLRAGRRGLRSVDAIEPFDRRSGNSDATPATSEWTIRWRAVKRATYYNVQVYRAGGRKVLSAWPVGPRLQLRARWRFNGRAEGLKAGTYRWYVWPGYGKQSARRYGGLLGTSTFIVGRTTQRR